ncbi:MAG: site-2 protease family protein [Candidatus Gracilibacteria bacterium]|nr:site-2 protease family protein [Candidatus Gracilibacteria bacterium]
MILGIIVAIIMFSVIILAHEYGHFKTARIFGVKVYEFGLGIPPRAKKIKMDKYGTIYSLNWLPLGGFVRLAGENIHTFKIYDEDGNLFNNEDLEKRIREGKKIYDDRGEEIPVGNVEEIKSLLDENNSPSSLLNKKIWQQAIVILAGVTMNFLLAIIVFSILFFVGVKPIGINTKIDTSLDIKIIPTIEQAKKDGFIVKKEGVLLYPIKGSIASKSNLKEGDIVYEVYTCKENVLDFVECKSGEKPQINKINKTSDLINIIKNNAGKKVAFYVNAGTMESDGVKGFVGGQFISVNIPESGKIGAYIGDNLELKKDFVYKFSILDSIKQGTIETYNQSLLTFKALGILSRKIFNPENRQERTEAINSVSGPVGTVNVIAKIVPEGLSVILIIGAIISINLGIFNLLPIPALDGGRFLFLSINGIVQKIFGKKAINERLEAIIHTGFFVFLIGLSIIIAYNDITKIINN